MDGVEPVGGIPVMAPPDPMEQLLALEMIRVTEAAAIESARFMGRGDKDGADAAATEAMRRTMDEIDFAGRIVIGEGERDEAPMLYIGERVGRTGADRDDVPRRIDERQPDTVGDFQRDLQRLLVALAERLGFESAVGKRDSFTGAQACRRFHGAADPTAQPVFADLLHQRDQPAVVEDHSLAGAHARQQLRLRHD